MFLDLPIVQNSDTKSEIILISNLYAKLFGLNLVGNVKKYSNLTIKQNYGLPF